MVYLTTLIVLAIAGLLIAGYIAYHHYLKQRQPMVCPLNHDCSAVTESRWSHVFGVRNETLGLAFYLTVLVGALVSQANHVYPPLMNWLFVASCGALVFSLVLIYIQVRVLRDYCFYCLISAGINLLIFANLWALR